MSRYDKTIMQKQIITIAMAGRTDGEEISPDRVRLGDLARFADEVKAFLQGSRKEVDAHNLPVSIQHGSVALRTPPLHGAHIV